MFSKRIILVQIDFKNCKNVGTQFEEIFWMFLSDNTRIRCRHQINFRECVYLSERVKETRWERVIRGHSNNTSHSSGKREGFTTVSSNNKRGKEGVYRSVKLHILFIDQKKLVYWKMSRHLGRGSMPVSPNDTWGRGSKKTRKVSRIFWMALKYPHHIQIADHYYIDLWALLSLLG
jgi:hypothetical protein